MTNKDFFYTTYTKAAAQITEVLTSEKSLFAPNFPAGDVMRRTIEQFVTRDGKRFRAALSFVTASLYGNEDIYPHIAVEIYHKYLLTHDDIIDRSDMRYGHPTVHASLGGAISSSGDKKHSGNSMAIIAGDLMSSASQQVITTSRLSDATKVKLTDCITRATNEVAWGWYDQFVMDYLPLSSPELSYDRILTSLIWVTGKYTITFPLRFGCIVAGKNYPEQLDEAANALAIIFQTGDDLLGIFGDPKQTGKSNYDDLSQGKKTLPIFFAYHMAQESEKRILEQYIGNPLLTEKEAAVIREIVSRSGALAKAKHVMQEYREVALRGIEASSLPPLMKKFLLGFADYLQDREK